jgi:hypothetical protein
LCWPRGVSPRGRMTGRLNCGIRPAAPARQRSKDIQAAQDACMGRRCRPTRILAGRSDPCTSSSWGSHRSHRHWPLSREPHRQGALCRARCRGPLGLRRRSTTRPGRHASSKLPYVGRSGLSGRAGSRFYLRLRSTRIGGTVFVTRRAPAPWAPAYFGGAISS